MTIFAWIGAVVVAILSVSIFIAVCSKFMESIKELYLTWRYEQRLTGAKQVGEYLHRMNYWFSEYPDVQLLVKTLGEHIHNHGTEISIQNIRGIWQEESKIKQQLVEVSSSGTEWIIVDAFYTNLNGFKYVRAHEGNLKLAKLVGDKFNLALLD